jgi:hypothetical protein
MIINWKPIETAPFETAVLVWDKSFEQAVVAKKHSKRIPSKSYWMIDNSYGFNEDGELDANDLTHWTETTPPVR